MFDYLGILMSGGVVTTTGLDDPSTSVDRDDSTGAVVIDLKQTPAVGLSVVMFCSDLAVGADAYTLTAFMEASDVLAFTSDIHRLGSFDVAGTSGGVILGIETPCVAITRIATDKRYLRVNLTVSNTFGYLKVYLTPYAFKVL